MLMIVEQDVGDLLPTGKVEDYNVMINRKL